MRPHQVVVWGATGFTGRLVCEHLAKHYHGRVRWAIAGRSSKKLEDLRRELTKVNPACNEVPILLADGTNKVSLDEMLGKTEVVVSTVGPFSVHGSLLVEASVEQGTHYCDITGEVPFVKQMYQKFNSAAEQEDVRIVHCCGFDSVPSDLGTYFVADYVKNTLGKGCAEVDAILHAEETKGGASGGTIESGMTIGKVFGGAEMSKLTSDQYYLVPEGFKKGSDKMTSLLPSYDSTTGRGKGLSIMEICNGRIVHFSNALRKEPYGLDFKFHEYTGYKGNWLAGRIYAGISTVLMLLFAGVLMSPLGGFARKYLPAPGEGPSRETMVSGCWAQSMVATTEEAAGGKPQKVVAYVAHKHGDPGYLSTSRMLLECALCLALQKDDLDKQGDVKRGGVMTPAVAFGMVLVNRLREAGFVFDIVSGGAGKEQAGVIKETVAAAASS